MGSELLTSVSRSFFLQEGRCVLHLLAAATELATEDETTMNMFPSDDAAEAASTLVESGSDPQRKSNVRRAARPLR